LCLAENEQQTNNHWKNLLIQLHDFSKSKWYFFLSPLRASFQNCLE
jgi:hypothetical protein